MTREKASMYNFCGINTCTNNLEPYTRVFLDDLGAHNQEIIYGKKSYGMYLRLGSKRGRVGVWIEAQVRMDELNGYENMTPLEDYCMCVPDVRQRPTTAPRLRRSPSTRDISALERPPGQPSD